MAARLQLGQCIRLRELGWLLHGGRSWLAAIRLRLGGPVARLAGRVLGGVAPIVAGSLTRPTFVNRARDLPTAACQFQFQTCPCMISYASMSWSARSARSDILRALRVFTIDSLLDMLKFAPSHSTQIGGVAGIWAAGSLTRPTFVNRAKRDLPTATCLSHSATPLPAMLLPTQQTLRCHGTPGGQAYPLWSWHPTCALSVDHRLQAGAQQTQSNKEHVRLGLAATDTCAGTVAGRLQWHPSTLAW